MATWYLVKIYCGQLKNILNTVIIGKSYYDMWFNISKYVKIRLGWFDELATLRTITPTLLLTRAILGLLMAQISVEIFVNTILILQSYKYLLLI